MPPVKRIPTPEEIVTIKAKIAGLSHDEKVKLATRTKPLVERRGTKNSSQKQKVPTTDDELWYWIKENTGYEIPRVAACPDHDAPFKFIADAFFERESALFLLGSREAGKTLNVSILHFANSELRPRTESLTFGAIEPQARRAYKHLKSFVYDETVNPDGTINLSLRPSVAGEPLRSETRWKNGSLTEIVVGSKSGVNSPHPQKVHADEVDLMDPDVWEESRSMSSSKLLKDGTRIKAQDFATSTRKSMTGLVQKILDEVDKAQQSGMEPPWKVYTSCVFENAEEVSCCRRAPSEEREARLAELGRDPKELCSCQQVAKGEWGEGVPRTLDTVCQGKFFKSRGWMPHEDVRRKFRGNSQSYWDAQMECRRAMADGLYLPAWTRERFSVVGWQPRPEFGNVWQGIDWGGAAESCLLYSQGPLRIPVTIQGANGSVTVPRGAYVVFDIFMKAEIGAGKLADEAISKEISWKRQIPGFRVTARFADMAGKQARDDWREHNPPLLTAWYLRDRQFDPTVKIMQGLVEDKRYWVDTRCSRHMDDIESWRQKKEKEIHDDSTHSMAASRYLHSNTETIERRRGHQGSASREVVPVVVQRGQRTAPYAMSSTMDQFAGEKNWRSQLGGPTPKDWGRP